MPIKNKALLSRLVKTTISSKQSVSHAAVYLAGFTVLQKVLSVIQQILIGRAFGASADTDAFSIAQITPLLVGGMIAIALTTALIPVLTGREALKPETLSGLFLVLVAMLVLLSLLVLVFGDAIIHFLGHGFDESTAAIALRLLTPMVLLVIFMGISGIFTAFFYAGSRFLLPAAAASLLYLGGIAGIFFKPVFGIDGLVWGLTIGSLFQFLVLGLSMDRGWVRSPVFDICVILDLFKTFVPIFLGMAISTFYLIIDRSFATPFPVGYVASFNFAGNLMTVPLQLVVTNINSALLPSLVLLKNAREEFSELFENALTWTGFLMVPAVVLMLTWSQPLVQLLFHSETFGLDAVGLTGGILAAYNLAILGLALKDLSTTALIALGRERLPMLVGVGGLVLSVLLKLVLLPRLGYLAIAYSTDIASALNGVILLLLLSSMLPLNWSRLLHASGWKLLTAALAMTACGFLLQSLVSPDGGLVKWSYAVVAAVVYALTCTVLRLPETDFLWKRVQLRWSNPVTSKR